MRVTLDIAPPLLTLRATMRSLRSLRAPAFSPARSLLRPRPPLLLAPARPRFLCVSAPRCSLLRPRPPLLRTPPRRWLCAPPRDPYTVLNVKRDATAAEIKAAYFKIAKRHHPDVNKSADAPRVFREAAEGLPALLKVLSVAKKEFHL